MELFTRKITRKQLTTFSFHVETVVVQQETNTHTNSRLISHSDAYECLVLPIVSSVRDYTLSSGKSLLKEKRPQKNTVEHGPA